MTGYFKKNSQKSRIALYILPIKYPCFNSKLTNIFLSKNRSTGYMKREEIETPQLNQQQVNKDINWYQQKILQYKEENKCSLRDIAKEIEISPFNLSKLLTGKRKRLSEETHNKLDKWIERREGLIFYLLDLKPLPFNGGNI